MNAARGCAGRLRTKSAKDWMYSGLAALGANRRPWRRIKSAVIPGQLLCVNSQRRTQQRRRVFIKIYCCVGMAAQDRRRRHRTDFSFKARFHRLRLSRIRYDRENLLGLKNLLHRHRERLLWHLRDISEPCLAHLLATAGLVQVDDQVWLLGLKIRGGIVEGDMAVLPNSEKFNIDGCR